MGGFTVQIEGLRELDARFVHMAGPDVKHVIDAGLRAGGEVFQAAIAERAPERPDLPSGTALPPGALKTDIELHRGRSDEGLPAVIVSPGKYTQHVARWVEYGHRLVRGGYNKKGKGGPGKEVGSVAAYPFIRPAYEAVREEAVSVAIEKMKAEVAAVEARPQAEEEVA